MNGRRKDAEPCQGSGGSEHRRQDRSDSKEGSPGLAVGVFLGTMPQSIVTHTLMTLISLAQNLVNARQLGTLVETSEHPNSVEAAYELQALVTEASQDRLTGFKIGATAVETQGILGLSEPFFGPLLNAHCRQANDLPSVFNTHPNHSVVIECEFVVGLKHDLKPDGAPLTNDDVAKATDWVAAGFELVGTRFHSTPHKGFCAIGDNGNNVAVITGTPHYEWNQQSLYTHPVSLSINEQQVASGHSGVSVEGHPFAMVAWLANHEKMQSRGLKAGEFVYTGTCTGAIQLNIGDVVEADFGSLGQLSLRLDST